MHPHIKQNWLIWDTFCIGTCFKIVLLFCIGTCFKIVLFWVGTCFKIVLFWIGTCFKFFFFFCIGTFTVVQQCPNLRSHMIQIFKYIIPNYLNLRSNFYRFKIISMWKQFCAQNKFKYCFFAGSVSGQKKIQLLSTLVLTIIPHFPNLKLSARRLSPHKFKTVSMAFVPTQISPSIVIFSHWSLISDHLWTHTKSLSIERGRKKRRLFVLTQNFLFFWSTIFYAYTARIKKQEIFIQNKDFFRDKTSLLKLINLKSSLKSIKVSYCTVYMYYKIYRQSTTCTMHIPVQICLHMKAGSFHEPIPFIYR